MADPAIRGVAKDTGIHRLGHHGGNIPYLTLEPTPDVYWAETNRGSTSMNGILRTAFEQEIALAIAEDPVFTVVCGCRFG